MKIRSSVILQSAWLPAKAAIPSFFSAADTARSDEKKSVRARKVVMSSTMCF